MKNILIIYPGFPHYRNGIIKKLLASKKNNYLFAADKNGYNNLKPFDFNNHSAFHHFPSFIINRFLFHKGLLRFVISQKADGAIVHASPYWPTIIIASVLLRLKGVPVFNWTHGILSNEVNTKNKFYYLFFKYTFNGLLLYGNKAKNNLIKLGYDNKKLKVIYNSLDYDKQFLLRDTLKDDERQKIRAKHFSQPDLNQLVFIGRLTSLKKLNLLIEVLKLLRDENISANLLFVGHGNGKGHSTTHW